MNIEKFNVLNRYTGEVQFTAEIAVTPDMTPSVKLGLAVRWGVKNKANLARANLADANLAGAYLADANLARANLARANLAGAYLARANLADANLADAYLADANLAGAYLADANLAGAYLADANLARANLADANLADAKNLKLPHFQIPQEGELIVWKKLAGGVLCKLRIPPEAKRTASVIGRKCRAEFAEVLEGAGTSWRGAAGSVSYAPGETVRPDRYDDNPLIECGSGIHFFLTREEAEEW